MKSSIDWFARNSVAANIVMVLILVAGIFTLTRVKMEVFPEIASETITVTVPYLGAAPEEVEEAVNARIEERLQDLEGIKRIRSVAREGAGTVTVELATGSDVNEVLDEVKARVDAIDTFPAETEKPIVQEVILRRQVINIAVSGNTEEATLKVLSERVRDEVLALPGITQVEIGAARPYEISIEVSEVALRRYGLTFDEITQAVRSSSLDLPGGSIRTDGGEVLLRTTGQAYRGRQFQDLVLRTRPDGSRITVGDVARVVDGFAETDQSARFDGERAMLVQVFRVGDQSALEVARSVKDYIAGAQARMPEGIQLTAWQDDSRVLQDRLGLLVRNGRAGLILVLLVLTLFLKLRLAGWVALGIPISFLGAIALMPTLDVSVNLISLFAFIVVLGIVVDDAIVVGENIYAHLEQGKKPLAAAIAGAQEVATPVTFAILTTVAAFAPLLFVEGNTGKIMSVIPTIVIACLVFSLFESLFILPAHLGHLKERDPDRRRSFLGERWRRIQTGFANGLERLVEKGYKPALEKAITWRYAVLAGAAAVLMMTLALSIGGWIKFTFFPPVEADEVAAFLTMPQGTPEDITAATVRRLEEAAQEIHRELEEEGYDGVVRHMLATIGDQPFRTNQNRGGGNISPDFSGSHLGEVTLELAPAEERTLTSPEIARRWREKVGVVPDANELVFSSSLFSTGEAINVQFSGPSLDDLQEAAETLKLRLADYPGVFDIADSFEAGKQELKLEITREAEIAGLTLGDVARQVRQAFYGQEAQRVQRGREELRVMVRYPEEERRSLENLETLRIRTPGGTEIPFSVAGDVQLGRGFAEIQRTDQKRTVNVTADVDLERANANEVIADLRATLLPELLDRYPGLRYSLEGNQQQQRETVGGLQRGFLFALVAIYGLLAVPFRSYIQPFIVMLAIPFGLIGAIWGHIFMGLDLTVLSGFGIVALTGVVVNDSLVMVDFINRAYRSGTPLDQAIRESGARRFRPILLTSLTTFVGLLPLLLEKSLQAQFLIPMATSLAFGVLFATVIILFLVPLSYILVEEIKIYTRRALGREEAHPLDEPEAPSPDLTGVAAFTPQETRS